MKKWIYKHKTAFIRVIIFVFIIILTYILLSFFLEYNCWKDWVEHWYANLFDPLITTATLLASIGAFLYNLAIDWNNKLPKRLTVHFVLHWEGEQKVIFTCLEAYLSGESDIRQWSQQIGKQKFGGNLDFFPYMTQREPEIRQKPKSKLDYNLYQVFIFLSKKPTSIHEVHYSVWDDNEDDTAGNSEYHFSQCPVYKKTKKGEKRDENAPPASIMDFHDSFLSKNVPVNPGPKF